MRFRNWLAVFAVVTLAGQAPSWAQSAADLIVIDGAKDPGAFPAWKVAEITLRHLGELSRPESAITNAGDRELLRLSAEAFSMAQKDTTQKFDKGRREGILNQPFDVVRKDEHRIRLEYRYRLLEIFDRLSTELPPDGQVALRLLSQSVVASTQISVRRDDLAAFREPR
jgi:hypothetical protein